MKNSEFVKEVLKEVEKRENEERTVKRLVTVQFGGGFDLSYLTDIETIEVGDMVIVEGKKESEIGTVTKVLKSFKIPRFEMKWVEKVVDRDITGEYFKVGDDIFSYNSTLTSEKFCTMYIGAKYDNEESYGEADMELNLSDFEKSDFIDDELVLMKGKAIYKGNAVPFISLKDGAGKAYVLGSQWYEIDFKFADGKVTYIACECPYMGNCKHEVALLFKLREALKTVKKNKGGENFVMCRKECFGGIMSAAKGKITVEY